MQHHVFSAADKKISTPYQEVCILPAQFVMAAAYTTSRPYVLFSDSTSQDIHLVPSFCNEVFHNCRRSRALMLHNTYAL